MVVTGARRIFVSYSREDGDFVRPVNGRFPEFMRAIRRLEQEGFEIFSDDSIQCGEQWSPVLEEQLASSEALIAVVSDDYLGSEFCRHEVETVIENGGAVFPFYYKYCAISQAKWLSWAQAYPNSERTFTSLESGDERTRAIINFRDHVRAGLLRRMRRG